MKHLLIESDFEVSMSRPKRENEKKEHDDISDIQCSLADLLGGLQLMLTSKAFNGTTILAAKVFPFRVSLLEKLWMKVVAILHGSKDISGCFMKSAYLGTMCFEEILLSSRGTIGKTKTARFGRTLSIQTAKFFTHKMGPNTCSSYYIKHPNTHKMGPNML